jgi:hypothetical protein
LSNILCEWFLTVCSKMKVFADFFVAEGLGDELDIFPKAGAKRFDMLQPWKTDLWAMWVGRRVGWDIF